MKCGTSFSVYLPLSDHKLEAVEEKKICIPTPGHGETILLVDDDENVRQTTSEVLNAMGYHVITACDGVEAVEIFKQQKSKIILIISDVIMPRMGGIDLLSHIRRLDDSLPFILATGYDKNQVVEQSDLLQDCQVINKPFDFDLLSLSIQTLINK